MGSEMCIRDRSVDSSFSPGVGKTMNERTPDLFSTSKTILWSTNSFSIPSAMRTSIVFSKGESGENSIPSS